MTDKPTIKELVKLLNEGKMSCISCGKKVEVNDWNGWTVIECKGDCGDLVYGR